jgi:hypothetical protein
MQRLRFAVGTPDGPQAGIWRVWTRPAGDIYLTPRLPARHFKISLHATGDWRLAYTGRLAEEERAAGRDRAPVKWRRPEPNSDGTTTALEILVPSSEVVTPPQPGSDDGRIVWREPPLRGFVCVFRLRLAPVGEDRSAAGVLGPLDAGKEYVWIETFERRETAEQRANLESARLEMCERYAGAFPSAGHLEVRTVLMDGNGRFVIDAVLPSFQVNLLARKRSDII